MKIILCLYCDTNGKVKYSPRNFKIQDDDICISNYRLGELNKNTLYYNMLEYKEELMDKTCWTINEAIRKAYVFKSEQVKVFTRVVDWIENADEIQIALSEIPFEDFDEKFDIDIIKKMCYNFNKQLVAEKNDIKFFKYTKKEVVLK